MSCVVGGVCLGPLSVRAQARLQAAYAPKTWNTYSAKFKMYMAFCIYVKVDVTQVDVNVVLMFLEFLVHNCLTPTSITNYVSAIRSQLKWFELPDSPWLHHRVTLMSKAIARTVNVQPKLKGVFDHNTLSRILMISATLPHSQVFITLYLFAFLVFCEFLI